MTAAERREKEPGNPTQPGDDDRRETTGGGARQSDQPGDDGRMLEVIDKGTCTEAHPVPLLFVHGGWHSASCWENFVDIFAHAGYRAVAMSLRGHGGSPTAKPFHACSIADYVDDVQAAADSLGGHPVLIAHSLSGFVVQRYLENHDAPAAALWRPCRHRACSAWRCASGAATRGSPCGRCRSAT